MSCIIYMYKYIWKFILSVKILNLKLFDLNSEFLEYLLYVDFFIKVFYSFVVRDSFS